MTFEVCCGSVSDAKAAEAGGASRIELNSALALGGLTPDAGCLKRCTEETGLTVIAMLRPRAGGFCYTEEETKTMFVTAELLLKSGADGLAFGFLTPERAVKADDTKRMADLIHSYGKCAVFHRAFDCAASFELASETLIAAGIDRILTSGGEAAAWDGRDRLCSLQQTYGAQIELLAGSGIRSFNAASLLSHTGLNQVHSSCRGYFKDETARANGVSFSYEGPPDWFSYEGVSYEEVCRMKQALLEYEERRGQNG